MRTQYRGLVLPVLWAVVVAVAAGCGSGSTGSSGGPGGEPGKTANGSGNGISATATISGSDVAITAHTDRDTALVWATVTGIAGQVALNGSGNDWSGTVEVNAQPSTVLDIVVYGRDSVGNDLGPVRMRVKVGEYGTQATVTGQVISTLDNSPVVGAQVVLGDQTAATDSLGKFVITGLIAGTHQTGVVTQSGFAEARFDVTVTTETVDVGKIALSATQDLPPPAPTFP